MACVVCVVSGLPGCGKTTWCYRIAQNPAPGWTVQHVEFDRLELEQQSEAWNAQVWHSSRKQAFEEVARVIDKAMSTKDSNSLILVDDNMYYKSMRKEVYSLAKSKQTGLMNIHFRCDKQLAKERNAKRERRVPESVIDRMAEIMEDPIERPEEFTLWLDTSRVQHEDNGFWKTVEHAASHPEKDVTEQLREATQQARQATQASKKHQTDLQLRLVIRDFLDTVDPREKAEAAQKAARAKKEVLQSGHEDAVNALKQALARLCQATVHRQTESL